ncbi:MAG: hypothetical protein OJF50_000024 [Nitrospira sp.]|nr:hypothetical protein [Nitrospira sp.]
MLQQHRGALIVGEMATGKTRTAVGACLIHGSRRVLVMAPPHLLRKWEREIKRVLPDAPSPPAEVAQQHRSHRADSRSATISPSLRSSPAKRPSSRMPRNQPWS